MKSIRSKILVCMILTTLVSLLLVGGSSIWLNYESTIDTLEQTMVEMAETAAERVEQELKVYKKIAYESGSIARLASSQTSVADKKAIIDQRAKTHGFQRGNIIGPDGISIFDGNDYSEREYFQKAMKGENAVSEPIISKITGELSIIISAPLWEGGIPNTKVVGVVYYVPVETFLNDIASSLQVSPGGSAYILNKNGVTIAHKNMNNVKNQENTQEDAKTDSKLKKLASLEQQMTEGKMGFGQYSYGGAKKFLSFAPIGDTDGWSIGINAPIGEFMGSTVTGIIITVVLLVISLLVVAGIAFTLAKRIGDPMKACAGRLEKLAGGDLDSPVPVIQSKDETMILAKATKGLVESFQMMIADMDYLLGSMARGDLTVESKCESVYVGGFSGLLQSSKLLSNQLNDTLGQINTASEQVASGSGQVSDGAQALSQGATEQASSVQELAATINEISAHVEKNAENANEANKQAKQTSVELEGGKKQMERMNNAMQEINVTSDRKSVV